MLLSPGTGSDGRVRPLRLETAKAPEAGRDQRVDRPWSLLIETIEEYAIFQLTPDGAVSTWNAGAHRIKGYTAAEILGRDFSVFYTAEDLRAGKPARELATAAEHGTCADEGWRVRKDSSLFWANVVITALYDDEGRLEGFVKVTRDESDRRRAAELEREVDRMAERERIGTAMSQTIVRQIFQVGLVLDGTVGLVHDPVVEARINDAVEQLDRTVQCIRSTVLDLATRSST